MRLNQNINENLNLTQIISHLKLLKIEVNLDSSPFLYDCSGFERKLLFVIFPKNHHQVKKSVELLNEYLIPFYSVSTGNNWGYGTTMPTKGESVLIHLKNLNDIKNFNPEMGTVDIGPGVTQDNLANFLKTNHYNYYVPTSGAGPDVSIIGNILERGFGMAPIEDHARSIVSLRAVMPDGLEFESYFKSINSPLQQAYSWGVGPYLDQLFTQSNMGIVTEVTIELIKKAEITTIFFYPINTDQEFIDSVEMFKYFKQNLIHGIGTLKIISREQLKNTSGDSTFLSKFLIKPARWNVMGTLHSSKFQKKSLRQEIKFLLKNKKLKGIQFYTEKKVNLVSKLISNTFLKNDQVIADSIQSFKGFYELSIGTPSSVGLKMIYPNEKMSDFINKNPAQDGIGLIWFSPLSVLEGEQVLKLYYLLKNQLEKFGFFNIPITFSVITSRSIAAVVPILFDKKDNTKANSVYKSLILSVKQEGFHPYRLPIEFMSEGLSGSSNNYWKIVNKIKKAVDPNNLYAEGRYSITI